MLFLIKNVFVGKVTLTSTNGFGNRFVGGNKYSVGNLLGEMTMCAQYSSMKTTAFNSS